MLPLGQRFVTAHDAKPASMVDLILCSAAERDYTEALCWYAERSVPAAEGFQDEFSRADV